MFVGIIYIIYKINIDTGITLRADLHRSIESAWIMMMLSSTDTTVFVSLAPANKLERRRFS